MKLKKWTKIENKLEIGNKLKIWQNLKLDKIKNWTKLKIGQNWKLDRIENWTKLNFEKKIFTSEQLRVFLNSKQSSEFSQSFQSNSQFFLSWMVKSHISLFINWGHPHFGDLSWSSALGSNFFSPSGAKKIVKICLHF